MTVSCTLRPPISDNSTQLGYAVGGKTYQAGGMDYEIERCTRHCAATGRELAPGEDFYSALVVEGDQTKRYDYSVDAWKGPPEGSIGWWKAQMPGRAARRMGWAPNDVMLELFETLADQPEQQDMRYVLGLLLVRRRVMRHDDTETDPEGREVMVLYCPRRETTFKVPAVIPDQARIDAIQQELARLLFAGAD